MTPSPQSTRLHRAGFIVLLVLAGLSLLAGLGLRDPSPPDEPRFVLAARDMVETGQWLFPHRGIQFYAEKPPVFMWLQAAAFSLTGHWRIAFLLPSLLAALLTLWLSYDLTARLWGRQAGRYAALGLFVCLQFGLQAKRGQIDMVLVAMTTLSLYGVVRHLLRGPDWRWAWLGFFAAGLGTVTKGVGFLPVLVLLPWAALVWRNRQRPRRVAPAAQAWRWCVAVLCFIAGAGVWVVPMLLAVYNSHDPAFQAYASEILFKQTGKRYADAWHHVQPFWYFLQVIATLWLPGALLLPWLLLSIVLAVVAYFVAPQGKLKAAAGILGAAWVGLGTVRFVWSRLRANGRFTPEMLGMTLAHTGIAVFLVGALLVEALNVQRELAVKPGQTVEVGRWGFHFQGVDETQGPNYLSDRGHVQVLRDGRPVTLLHPEKRAYASGGQVMTEAGIRPGLFGDVYVALGESLGGEARAVRIHIKPFVRWIWLGAGLMALGGFVTATDRRFRKPEDKR